jgi:phosphatidylglycerophosphatase A
VEAARRARGAALPGGFGVVADDVIAGITACAVQHGIWALAARVLH